MSPFSYPSAIFINVRLIVWESIKPLCSSRDIGRIILGHGVCRADRNGVARRVARFTVWKTTHTLNLNSKTLTACCRQCPWRNMLQSGSVFILQDSWPIHRIRGYIRRIRDHAQANSLRAVGQYRSKYSTGLSLAYEKNGLVYLIEFF